MTHPLGLLIPVMGIGGTVLSLALFFGGAMPPVQQHSQIAVPQRLENDGRNRIAEDKKEGCPDCIHRHQNCPECPCQPGCNKHSDCDQCKPQRDSEKSKIRKYEMNRWHVDSVYCGKTHIEVKHRVAYDSAKGKYRYDYRVEYNGKTPILMKWDVLDHLRYEKDSVIIELNKIKPHVFVMWTKYPPVAIDGKIKFYNNRNKEDYDSTYWRAVGDDVMPGPVPYANNRVVSNEVIQQNSCQGDCGCQKCCGCCEGRCDCGQNCNCDCGRSCNCNCHQRNANCLQSNGGCRVIGDRGSGIPVPKNY